MVENLMSDEASIDNESCQNKMNLPPCWRGGPGEDGAGALRNVLPAKLGSIALYTILVLLGDIWKS